MRYLLFVIGALCLGYVIVVGLATLAGKPKEETERVESGNKE